MSHSISILAGAIYLIDIVEESGIIFKSIKNECHIKSGQQRKRGKSNQEESISDDEKLGLNGISGTIENGNNQDA